MTSTPSPDWQGVSWIDAFQKEWHAQYGIPQTEADTSRYLAAFQRVADAHYRSLPSPEATSKAAAVIPELPERDARAFQFLQQNAEWDNEGGKGYWTVRFRSECSDDFRAAVEEFSAICAEADRDVARALAERSAEPAPGADARDAERYRWLRKQSLNMAWCEVPIGRDADEIDRLMDAAIQGTGDSHE